MKRTAKPVFFIVALLIFALTYTAFFGVYTHYGDRRDTIIRGAADIRFGIDIRGGVDVTFAPEDESIEVTADQMNDCLLYTSGTVSGRGLLLPTRKSRLFRPVPGRGGGIGPRLPAGRRFPDRYRRTGKGVLSGRSDRHRKPLPRQKSGPGRRGRRRRFPDKHLRKAADPAAEFL